MTNPFIPILIMFGLAAALAIGGMAAPAVVGPKRYNRVKVDACECGIPPPRHAARIRFPLQDYPLAPTFILFYTAVVFLFPSAVAFKELAVFGLIAMLTFLFLITVPFIYEWRRGGLDWD